MWYCSFAVYLLVFMSQIAEKAKLSYAVPDYHTFIGQKNSADAGGLCDKYEISHLKRLAIWGMTFKDTQGYYNCCY